MLQPEGMDMERRQKRFTENLYVSLMTLRDQSDSDNIRNEILKLAEDVRFSDPNSTEALQEPEKELEYAMQELTAAVDEGNEKDVRTIIRAMKNSLRERNRLCRLEK